MQFRISCSKMCTLCINYKRRLQCIWLTDRNMILSINLDFRIKAGFLHVIVDQEKTVWESGHVMIAQGELSVQVMSVIIYYCYLHFIIYLVVSWLVAQGMYFSDAHWIRGHFSFFLRCTNVFTKIIVSDTCLVRYHPYVIFKLVQIRSLFHSLSDSQFNLALYLSGKEQNCSFNFWTQNHLSTLNQCCWRQHRHL